MTSPAEIDNPYVGPRPFERNDALWFKGRQQESRDLLTLFLARRLVLLYAPSGAGKTSLLKAKLIPDLEKEEAFEVLPVGRVGDSVLPPNDFAGNRFIFNLLVSLGICDKPELIAAEETSLNHFLLNVGYDGKRFIYFNGTQAEAETEETLAEALAEDEGVPVQPRALIIDQFEEMFTMHPELEAERIDFFKQVGEAMVNDPYLYVMFSMRGDYLYRIIPYVHLLPNSLRARFQLQRLQKTGALQAVCEPAAEAGRPFDADVAEKLVKCLRRVRLAEGGEVGKGGKRPLGDFVEAMQLQVVCQQLWQRLKERPGATICMADVDWVVERRSAHKTDKMDSLDVFVENALADYYEDALQLVLKHLEEVGQNQVDEYVLRRWFSIELITEAGTRDLLARMDRETKGMPETAVDYLDKELHLIRNEIRGGNNFIELVHDSFVEPIQTANQEWQEELERRIPWLNAARRYVRNPNPRLLLADYNSLQAARTRMAEEAEKGDLPLTTLQFLDDFLAKGEEAYQRQLIQDVPWLSSARQFAETENPDLLFQGNTLQLAIEQAAKAKAKGNLPIYADDFLQASIEADRKLEIKRLRQQEEARRREELAEQKLAHERSLTGEQRKRAGIAIGFGTLAIVLAIAASFFGISARNNAEIARDREATAVFAEAEATKALATAIVDREVSVTQEAEAVNQANLAATAAAEAATKAAEAAAAKAEAEEQQHLANSLRLAALARDYLNNGQVPSALLLSIEASKAFIQASYIAADKDSLTSAQDEVQSILLEALFNFNERGNVNQNLKGRFFRDVITTPFEAMPTIFPGPQPGTVATMQDGSVVYWQLGELMPETLEIPGITEPISQTTISQNGSRLALLQNKTIEVYPITEGVVQDSIASFDLADGFNLAVMTFNRDGSRLAAAVCPKEVENDSDRNNSSDISGESNCRLEIYAFSEAAQNEAEMTKTCRLTLPTVTAVSFLEQADYLVLSGTEGLAPAPVQLLYVLDLSIESCRPEKVSLSPDHTIQTITVLPETANQPGFVITAGFNLQWWRFDEAQAQLQPFGPMLPLPNPVKGSLFWAGQQSYVALDTANNTVAYNTNLSQWPELGCGMANRNLTYTEWENAFPIDELEDYHQTCDVYGYEAFGVHISLAQHQLQQAQDELQQCNLTHAQINFNRATDLAAQSSYGNYISQTFSPWALRQLLSLYMLSSTDCTISVFQETLQRLANDEALGEDLKIFADDLREGKQQYAEGEIEEALAQYENVMEQISDPQFPGDYQDVFDGMLVNDYSNICTNRLIYDYEVACGRLTEFASPLQSGSSYLADTEEIQLWEFEAAEGDFVSIVMNVFESASNSLDPYVTLLDAEANQVASEDEYRSGQYSKITLFKVLEDGLYYARAAGYEGQSSGPYELTVTVYNDPTEIEPGISQTAATEETQFWSFAGQEGDFFNISMSAVDGSFEPQLQLLNSEGFQLNNATGDNGTATLSSIPIYETGTYYLLASGLGEATGQYKLLISRTVPITITVGELETADVADVQMWQFSGDAGQIVSVEMAVGDESLITPYFELLDASGNYLTASQLSADGRSALLITYFIPTTDNYYLRTSDLSGQGNGIYNLVITALDEQTIDVITLDSSRPGSLEQNFLWRLELQENIETAQLIRIQMRAIGQPSFTPYLTLLDNSGWEIQAATRTDDDFITSEATFFVAPHDTYFIRAAGNNGEVEGQYTIRAELADIPVIDIDGDSVIGDTAEEPVWSFVGNEGETVVIAMNEVESGLDTLLVLYDARGEEIAFNDDSNDTLNSLIEITLPEDGQYFIHAQGYGGNIGTYELSVRFAEN